MGRSHPALAAAFRASSQLLSPWEQSAADHSLLSPPRCFPRSLTALRSPFSFHHFHILRKPLLSLVVTPWALAQSITATPPSSHLQYCTLTLPLAAFSPTTSQLSNPLELPWPYPWLPSLLTFLLPQLENDYNHFLAYILNAIVPLLLC